MLLTIQCNTMHLWLPQGDICSCSHWCSPPTNYSHSAPYPVRPRYDQCEHPPSRSKPQQRRLNCSWDLLVFCMPSLINGTGEHNVSAA